MAAVRMIATTRPKLSGAGAEGFARCTAASTVQQRQPKLAAIGIDDTLQLALYLNTERTAMNARHFLEGSTRIRFEGCTCPPWAICNSSHTLRPCGRTLPSKGRPALSIRCSSRSSHWRGIHDKVVSCVQQQYDLHYVRVYNMYTCTRIITWYVVHHTRKSTWKSIVRTTNFIRLHFNSK